MKWLDAHRWVNAKLPAFPRARDQRPPEVPDDITRAVAYSIGRGADPAEALRYEATDQ